VIEGPCEHVVQEARRAGRRAPAKEA
jgi:hypothetical protein